MHIAKLKEVYGEFNYAPYKTPFDPESEMEQLKVFLPNYSPNACVPASKPETAVSNSNDSASNPKQKKRTRSESRNRKPANEDKEDSGVHDENCLSFGSERRNQSHHSADFNSELSQCDTSCQVEGAGRKSRSEDTQLANADGAGSVYALMSSVNRTEDSVMLVGF